MSTSSDKGRLVKRCCIGVAIIVVVAVCVVLAVCCLNSSQTTTSEVESSKSSSASSSASSSSAAEPTMSANVAAAKSAVEAIVSKYGDTVSVSVLPLDGGLGFSIAGDKSYSSASMIKLLILRELLEQVNAGTVSLDDTYALQQSDIVGGAGYISGSPIGTVYTLEELAKYMTAISDNTAANVLINRLGMENINARAKTLGLNSTDLQRKLMDTTTTVDNHMSANDAAALLYGFQTNAGLPDSLCAKARSFLLMQTDTEGILEGLPSGIDFAHKTGSLASFRHDAGIVYAKVPYIIAVFTSKDTSSGNAVMREVSAAVYQAMES